MPIEESMMAKDTHAPIGNIETVSEKNGYAICVRSVQFGDVPNVIGTL